MVEVPAIGTLLIRADATTQMGTGHIMRCLSLAQAWIASGGAVTMLSHCESQALRQRAESCGVEFKPLAAPHPDPTDLKTVLEMLQRKPAWAVLDGYHLDTAYQRKLREAGHRVMVIDDTAHLLHYHADVLVNQNINAPSLEYRTDPDTTRLLGTKYAMLRPEFHACRGQRRETPVTAERILVTLGGGDPDNVTLKVVQALNQITGQVLDIAVVAGYSNPNLESLRQETERSRHQVRLLSHVEDMPALMTWTDLAFCAGGSTCWEMAFMGVPMAVLVIADNQTGIAQGLETAGAAANMGWHRTAAPDHMAKVVSELLLNDGQREEMTRCGQLLLDGDGASRIVQRILADALPTAHREDTDSSASLTLRLAEEADCALLWEWANDPDVRAAAFSTDAIPWDDHQRWFRNRMHDENSRLFLILYSNEPIGQVRFDSTDEAFREAEIDISLAQAWRGRGIGAEALQLACEQVRACVPSLHTLNGYVRVENPSSQRIFTRAGFENCGCTTRHGHSAWHFQKTSTPRNTKCL